jgi:hypothetical protein
MYIRPDPKNHSFNKRRGELIFALIQNHSLYKTQWQMYIRPDPKNHSLNKTHWQMDIRPDPHKSFVKTM